MKIVVWGQELTAWVTAAALANAGNKVFIVDDSEIDEPELLLKKGIHNEPGLKDMVSEAVGKNNLQLISDTCALTFETHIISLNANDYKQARGIVENIGKSTSSSRLVINQSHFGIGFTDKLQDLLDLRHDQVVVYLAENISEGEAIKRVQRPRSITLGSSSPNATEIVTELLKPFTKQLEHFFVVSPKEA